MQPKTEPVLINSYTPMEKSIRTCNQDEKHFKTNREKTEAFLRNAKALTVKRTTQRKLQKHQTKRGNNEVVS